MTAPTRTLYRFVPFDRSGRVAWMLEELGLAYQVKELDFRKGDTRTPEYLAISPVGKVPALVEGESVLFETPAILQHLAEVHGKLCVPPGHPERAAFLSWLSLASASFDPVCFEFVRPDLPKEAMPARIEQSRKDVVRYLDALERVLVGRDTVLAVGFTVVDLQLVCCLKYAEAGGVLGGRERLLAYMETHCSRPAVARAKPFR